MTSYTNGCINPLDFSYIDSLRSVPLLNGRVFKGKHAEQPGDQPLLLFVHGAYHGAWCYSSYLEYFDRLRVPVAAVDLNGHGGLIQDEQFHRLSVSDYSRTVTEACRVFTRPVILVGHSLGALVVGLAANWFRIKAIGFLAPSPPGQLQGAKKVPLVDECAAAPPPTERVCRRMFLPDSEGIDLTDYLNRLCPESPAALNDRYDLRVSFSPQRVPAICIAAGADSLITHPPGQDEAVAKFYGAEFHLIDGAAHCFMLSRHWQDTAQLLFDWYGRNADET